MSHLPLSLQKLIDWLQVLPWVWEKTAQRFAFYLLKQNKEFLSSLWNTIANIKDKIKECELCSNFSEKSLCPICENHSRKSEQICIIESPFDVLSMERPWIYRWVYHVLHWVLSPIDWINPENLRISKLLDRLDAWGVEELIFAINPSLEWEATGSYINQKIKNKDIKVTMLARGISVWGDLEYTDELTIMKALELRIPF